MKPKYKIREIICEGCKKKISKRMPKGRKYCSLSCYRKSKRPQRRTGKEVFCKWCNKKVYKQKSHLNNRKNLFCSFECATKFQGRNKLKFICKICNKNFYWSKSRVKKQNPIYCSLECRDKDPMRRKMLISFNILQQKTKINGLEKKGYSILDSLGIDYKKQFLIGDKFLVDAFIPKYNLIVQFDGDYWHGNLEKYSELSERQKKRRRIDNSQNAYFKKCGFNVLRIWESQINELGRRIENDYIKRTI